MGQRVAGWSARRSGSAVEWAASRSPRSPQTTRTVGCR
jgi:hypothetical protein